MGASTPLHKSHLVIYLTESLRDSSINQKGFYIYNCYNRRIIKEVWTAEELSWKETGYFFVKV